MTSECDAEQCPQLARSWWTWATRTAWVCSGASPSPYWSLRPVCGGTEWEAEPNHVRPATADERLHADTARANARSRGEVL